MEKKISVERIYNLDLNGGQTEPNSKLLTKELFFDEQGNVIKEITCNPPGIVDQTIESKYDTKNRLTEEACFDEDDEMLEKTMFFWDEENRKIKEEKHYLDGAFDTIIFTYNSNGDLIEKLQKDDDDEIEAKEIFVYQDKYLLEHLKYGEDEELEEKKTFLIKDGKIASETHWESSEQIETKKEFRFTEDGSVEKELFYNAKGELVKKIEYLKYNKRFVLEFVEEDPYNKNTTKLVYDENDKIIRQEQVNRDGEVNHRIERIYDDNQQIVESLTFVNSKGQGVNLHFKEIHQYEYYD